MHNIVLHHLGFLTNDIKSSVSQFKLLGYNPGQIVEDVSLQVSICFLTSSNGEKIELIQALNYESSLSHYLRKKGIGLYHLCFETSDLHQTISELTKHSFVVITPPQEALVFNGRSIAFLHASHTGIIELLERLPLNKH